jgi:hypothetical protein
MRPPSTNNMQHYLIQENQELKAEVAQLQTALDSAPCFDAHNEKISKLRQLFVSLRGELSLIATAKQLENSNITGLDEAFNALITTRATSENTKAA